jgi:hypothetical protein
VNEKLSRTVNLVILGLLGTAVALPLLPQGEEMRRNVYRTKEDCLSDYSEPECEPTREGSGGHGSGSWYRGPTYRSDRTGNPNDAGPGRYQNTYGARNPSALSSESSFRGGFGNISRRFGIGG